MNVSKRARLTHIALLAAAIGSGGYMAKTDESTSEYTMLLRSKEAAGVIKSMEQFSRPSGRKIGPKEIAFVKDVLDYADRASRELRIPRKFILAQWSHESGGFNDYSIRHNNLAGIQWKDSLRSFNNMDKFTKNYIDILKYDHIQNLTGLRDFVVGLHRKGYFTDNVDSYFRKVSMHLNFMQAANPEYGQIFNMATRNPKPDLQILQSPQQRMLRDDASRDYTNTQQKNQNDSGWHKFSDTTYLNRPQITPPSALRRR